MITILVLWALGAGTVGYTVGRVVTIKKVDKNTKALARWADRVLTNDELMPSLPRSEISRGRQLVDTYYDRP